MSSTIYLLVFRRNIRSIAFMLAYHCDLTRYNTLALRATAASLFRYRSSCQLPEITRLASQHERVFVLGGGSNTVFASAIGGVVIKVESQGVRVLEDTPGYRLIEVQAGESWDGLVRYCVAQGWGGLENLGLIPGTVGAAPVQNIGAYGVELDEYLDSVLAWDLTEGRLHTLAAADCGFTYRSSRFKEAQDEHWLIVAVRLRLPKEWQPRLHYPDLRNEPVLTQYGDATPTPQQVYSAVCAIRRRKLPDPDVLANAGSFFKNPVVDSGDYERLRLHWPKLVAYPQADGRWKLAAAWLIQETGWKGRRLGPVGMHARQALVLVNHAQADHRDVLALAQRVREDVYRTFGVKLEQEPVDVL